MNLRSYRKRDFRKWNAKYWFIIVGFIIGLIFLKPGKAVVSYTSSDKYCVTYHIHLQADQTALSTLTAIMGRTAAYKGRAITWDEIFKSDMDLGPAKIEFVPVDMVFETPVPGSPVIV